MMIMLSVRNAGHPYLFPLPSQRRDPPCPESQPHRSAIMHAPCWLPAMSALLVSCPGILAAQALLLAATSGVAWARAKEPFQQAETSPSNTGQAAVACGYSTSPLWAGCQLLRTPQECSGRQPTAQVAEGSGRVAETPAIGGLRLQLAPHHMVPDSTGFWAACSSSTRYRACMSSFRAGMPDIAVCSC